MTTFEYEIENILDYPRINELLDRWSFFNGIKDMVCEFVAVPDRDFNVYFNFYVGLIEYPNKYDVGFEYQNWEFITQRCGWIQITEIDEAMGIKKKYMYWFDPKY